MIFMIGSPKNIAPMQCVIKGCNNKQALKGWERGVRRWRWVCDTHHRRHAKVGAMRRRK